MNLNTKKQKSIAKGVLALFLFATVFFLSYILTIHYGDMPDTSSVDDVEVSEVVYGLSDDSSESGDDFATEVEDEEGDEDKDEEDEDSTSGEVKGATDFQYRPLSSAGDTYDLGTVTLTLSSGVGGVTNPDEGEYIYESGSSVTIGAISNEGYEFLNWTENGTVIATSSEYTFDIQSDRSLQANFVEKQYELVLTADENGSVSSVGGIYGYGEVVDIEALVDDGYLFSSWEGDVEGVDDVYAASTSVEMYGDYEIIANFVEAVSLTILPAEGEGSTNLTVGEHIYPIGSSITLSATAAEGYEFVAWLEDGIELPHDKSYTFDLNKDRDLGVRFQKQKYNLEISVHRSGGSVEHAGDVYTTGDEAGIYVYEHGDEIEIEAIPDAGEDGYVEWLVNEESMSGVKEDGRFFLRMVMDGNYDVLVRFQQVGGVTNTYSLDISSGMGGNVANPGEGSYTYDEAQQVDLVATSDTYYTFSHWSGDVSGIDDIYAADTFVTMNNNYSIEANYILEVVGTAFVPNTGGTVLFNTEGANVGINPVTGEILRYAWLDDLGWIDFDGVSLNKADGQVVGSATVLSTGQKIYFDEPGDNSGSEVFVDLANGSFSGYAWSDDIGWIEFDNVDSPGVHSKTITYNVSGGGSIVGDSTQTVDYWGSGSEVVAEPDLGYFFAQWDDGEEETSRIDTDIIEDLTITAEFELLGSIEVVDSGGELTSADLSFSFVDQSTNAQESTAVLGLDEQRLRVSKGNYDGGFSLNLSVSSANWSDGGTSSYPYNSELAEDGLLEVDPSAGNFAGVGECGDMGLSLGSETNFYANSDITLLDGDSNSAANCQWDLTGVELKQTIPGGTLPGVYTIDMVLTLL